VIQYLCERCEATVARVYETDDGSVLFAGRARDPSRATVQAAATGIEKRRHRRDTWLGVEVPLRADGYAQSEPEAWCPDHGNVVLPGRRQMLAAFDKAASEDRRVHHRVHPAR
jgi:hypothetical protein